MAPAIIVFKRYLFLALQRNIPHVIVIKEQMNTITLINHCAQIGNKENESSTIDECLGLGRGGGSGVGFDGFGAGFGALLFKIITLEFCTDKLGSVVDSFSLDIFFNSK